MPIIPEFRWTRASARVYFCHREKENVGMVFGAPEGTMLWCSVVWIDQGRGGHRAAYHVSLKSAKRWVIQQNGGMVARLEAGDANTR